MSPTSSAPRTSVLAPALALLVGCGAAPPTDEELPRPTASASQRTTPPRLPDGRVAARAVTRTEDATCVLLEDRTVWCFGGLYAARGGRGGVHQVPLPPVSGVVAAPGRIAAWTAQGEVFEWGGDDRGFFVPGKLAIQDARELALAEHALCVRFDDRVTCTGTSDPPVWTVDVAATAVSIRRDDRCFATPEAVHCAGLGTTFEHPLPHVEELAASTSVTCARTKERRVHCWSTNPDLQDELFGARQFIGLEGNADAICALPLVGAPACVAAGPPSTTPEAVSLEEVLAEQRGVTSMQVSRTGACFVEAGAVRCWTAGDAEATPIDMGDLTALHEARDVGVGLAHACVLGLDDVVRCWGESASGALGVDDGGAGAPRWPERIPGLPPVARLTVGPHMTCVVTRAADAELVGASASDRAASSNGASPRAEPGGRVFCTGAWTARGEHIDCAAKEWPCTREPTLVTTDASDVALGDAFGCALGVDRGVRCWGANDHGQLGAGDTVASATPRPVIDATSAPIAGVRKLVAGDAHACALLEDGAVLCWGYDQPDTQSSRAAAPERTFATRLTLPKPAVDVSDRCVVLEDGEMRCWGERPDRGSSKAPVRVGVCDATRLIGGGCALGPRGVVCIGRDRRPLGPAMEGPQLTSASAYGARLCGVDARNHVRCRRLDDAAPEIGDTLLAVLLPQPTAACPADPLDVAPPPRGASPLYL